MTAATDARLGWVDAAKGLSIFLVVLSHSYYWLAAAGYDVSSPFGIDDALASMRMPLFFFAAGLFAVKHLQASWSELISRKLRFLVWPFLVWQVVGIAYSVVAGLMIHGESSGGVIAKSLAKPVISVVRPSNELWFLWALAFMFVLTKLAWTLPVWARLAVTAIPSLVFYAVPDDVSTVVVEAAGLGWSGVARYWVVFMVASLLAGPGAAAIARTPKPLVAVGIIPLALAVMASSRVDLGPGNVLFMFTGLGFGIALALLLQRVAWLRALGKHTLPVYVMHTTLIVAVVTMLEILTVSFGPALQVVPFMLAVAVTVGVYQLRRPMERGPLRWAFEPPSWFRLRSAQTSVGV